MNAIVLSFKKLWGRYLGWCSNKFTSKKKPCSAPNPILSAFFLGSPPPISREITTTRRAVETLDLFFWQQPQVFFLVWFLRISDQTNPAHPSLGFGLGSHSLPLPPLSIYLQEEIRANDPPLSLLPSIPSCPLRHYLLGYTSECGGEGEGGGRQKKVITRKLGWRDLGSLPQYQRVRKWGNLFRIRCYT